MSFPTVSKSVVPLVKFRRRGADLDAFRRRVLKLRKKMTQREVAAHLGITKQYVQKLEAQARAKVTP